MLKRTITGFFILLVLAGMTALRMFSRVFFDALVLVLSYGCIVETFMAFKIVDKKFLKFPIFLLPVGFWAIFRYTSEPLVWCLVALFGVLVITVIADLAITRSTYIGEGNDINTTTISRPLDLTQTTVSVAIYPTFLIAFLFGINYLGIGLGYVGIIMVFAISIFTDVFAYCFGVMFGKNGTKFAPTISPNKSVVGSVFGLLGGLVAGGLGWVFFYQFGWFNALGHLTLGWSIGLFALLAVLGSVITQIGDLVSSAFKRRAGLKDFGTIFPGHGGFMDRIDGQMFNFALVYVLFMLIV